MTKYVQYVATMPARARPECGLCFCTAGLMHNFHEDAQYEIEGNEEPIKCTLDLRSNCTEHQSE